MMARTQLTLDPELHRQARDRAADLGISLAEYMRRLVARDLRGQPPRVAVTAVFDLGSSGGSNVARFKERYLDEALEAEYRRRNPDREGG